MSELGTLATHGRYESEMASILRHIVWRAPRSGNVGVLCVTLDEVDELCRLRFAMYPFQTSNSMKPLAQDEFAKTSLETSTIATCISPDLAQTTNMGWGRAESCLEDRMRSQIRADVDLW